MTFPGTFWKAQNPGIQVQIFEYLKKSSIILGPKSIFSDPNFGFSGSRFGFSRSDFPKKVLREPGSKRRKIKVSESIQIDSNRSKDLQNDLDSMFSSHFRRFRQKSPNLLGVKMITFPRPHLAQSRFLVQINSTACVQSFFSQRTPKGGDTKG